ncbi:MAG: long-chain fatty acid--CoA ligase [Pseudomonadota bacterium]
MIFGDWIGRWGQTFPQGEAVYDAITDRRYTYGDLSREVNRLARFLSEGLGVEKGDRVSCLSLNRAEYITLFFATSRLGAVLVPLNFRLAAAEFDYFLQDAGPKVLFHDAEHETIALELRHRFNSVSFVRFGDGPDGPSPWAALSDQAPPEVEIAADDPQLIIYTSGTTGLPKGVILTHGMIEANAVNTVLGWDLSSRDRTILHAAMFYTAGWNVFTLPLFLTRASNILVKSFDPDLILDLIEKEKVTVFFGVPTMYRMLIDSPRFERADFSSLRFMVSGGAALGRDIFDIFKERKGVHLWEGYGLTEVGPNNFIADGKLGTLGHVMPGVDIRLVDQDGRDVPRGREGQILLRGRHMCAGYWNKPEATAESIKDGWFQTGDLGRVDEDGHYIIAGRLKDMIISGGVNIYPAEIERVVEAHPDVVGAAIIGVPDPKWGEVGKAVVELRPGASLDLAGLNAFLIERLGRFKLPKHLTVVETLPRTPASGKIQKFLLKKEHGRADDD